MLRKLISILAILSLIFTMAIIPVNAETASLEQLKATFDEAKAEYEAALDKIVFSEDFEGTTNKLGVFNPKGSMKNFTEALVTDNGNTYEKVTVTGGSWYGSNTGDGTVVSLFKTAEKTDYVVRFKINQTVAMKSNHFYTVGNKALAGGYNAVNPSAFSVDSTTKSTNNTFCSLNANIGNSANLNKWHDIEVTFNTGDYTYAGFYINLGLADGTSSADVLIDDIMVIPAADLATFDTAKANYEAAETAYLDALKAQTKSDFNSAMTDFSAKEAAYNSALNKVVFAEDYEDTANVKMDSISGSAGTSNFTTNYVSENGNTYAKVTSTGTTWYGIRTSSSTYTALNLALNTEYIITFKYRTEG